MYLHSPNNELHILCFIVQIEEGLQAERLAQTVKEFNYYIGHALISLSRLEMTMNNPPPRPVKLAPTRRSEMRRVMRDLRNMPPRAPSGYIVDIQRDGGPVPVGTRNAPAPTDPLTSVALGCEWDIKHVSLILYTQNLSLS